MKKKLYVILLLFVGSALPSCKDFLDEQPLHSLTGENAIKDLTTAKAALGGVYASFQNDSWSGALYVAQATKSGFVNITAQTDYDLTYNESNPGSNVPGIWQNFYKSLNAANFAIEGIGKLSEAAVPLAERTAMMAEGRCLRAWIHANVLWNFGHWWAEDADAYGIIYRDEVISLKNVLKARSTVGESYQKIYEDLDYAIANLGEFSSPRYLSKQFAKALKAKLLLYRGGYRNTTADLQLSLTLVNEILANPSPSFAMEPNLADVYGKAWDSNENLFVRYLEDDGSRAYTGGFNYTYGIIYGGDRLPLPIDKTLTAGLKYGVDWFKADPRWPVVTGSVRAPETWDDKQCYCFKKLARLGRYAGAQANPKDEKYAAYYFRYSELYLMKAELLARTGAAISTAIAPINEMRSKRTNPVLMPLNPQNSNELMDLIFKEIFMELFMENGSEMFAAVRFKKDGQPWIVAVKENKAFELNKLCWPIPRVEMVNNTLMVQNPDLK
jgi:hypothetical protein